MKGSTVIAQVFASLTGKEIVAYKDNSAYLGALENRPRLKRVAELCAKTWPGDLIEIGLGHGKTTIIFAEIARKYGRKVIGVDPFTVMGTGWGDDYYDTYMKITEPWRDFIDLIKLSSMSPEAMAAIKARDLCFAYVDGLHTYGACLSDILTVGHCKGIIAVDDLHNQGRGTYEMHLMQAFLDGAISLGRVPMDNFLSREGYLVSR